jgi:hypothetical protein
VSFDRDELWTTFLEEATVRADCSQPESTCRIDVRHTPLYAQFLHLDDAGHACGVCNPAVLPTHITSVHSLQTIRREVLVARLALWLCHLHESPTNLRAADGSGAADGDAPAASAPSGGCPSSVRGSTAGASSATDCAAA